MKKDRNEKEELVLSIYCNVHLLPPYFVSRTWENVRRYSNSAAVGKCHEAWTLYGLTYAEGVFLDRFSIISVEDYLKAYKCYKEALKGGFFYSSLSTFSNSDSSFQDPESKATAEFAIAKMHDEGWGVKQDYTIAKDYYQSSARKGYEGSNCNVKILFW